MHRRQCTRFAAFISSGQPPPALPPQPAAAEDERVAGAGAHNVDDAPADPPTASERRAAGAGDAASSAGKPTVARAQLSGGGQSGSPSHDERGPDARTS
jgi:hypothetical protein